MSQTTPESILIADIGAVATKVGLVDRVGSGFRLIGCARALTTIEPPEADASVGVRRAIAELENVTGRRLLGDDHEVLTPERVSGQGVDAFVAITSAALPLRAAIVGLSRDFSVASAQRALASTYALVENYIAVDEESGRWGTTARDGRAGGPSISVEQLAASHPEVIVMVGGIDGGAYGPLLEMANIVAGIGAALEEGTRPLVVFAGNREARAAVAERIGALMEFRAVDNVRPTLDVENLAPLENELYGIFYERKLKPAPGLARINAWSARPLMAAANAYEKVAQFLARRFGLRVLALDLGAATTVLVRARATRASRALLADIGLGYGLDALVTRVGLERVARWLPNSIALEDAHARLLNQTLRPWSVPTLPEDVLVLNAAAREALALNAERPGGVEHPGGEAADLILLTGAPIARGVKPNALFLLMLDALDLRGIFSVAADATGLAPALGALAAVNAEAAAQVVERDGFVTLGTALVPRLPPPLRDVPLPEVEHSLRDVPPGRTVHALNAVLETPGGGRLQVQVATGSLELIPLGLGEKAQVTIRPAHGVDLGARLKNGVLERELEGGTVGLIIDARGRPLSQALSLTGRSALEQQRERAQKWLWDVGA